MKRFINTCGALVAAFALTTAPAAEFAVDVPGGSVYVITAGEGQAPAARHLRRWVQRAAEHMCELFRNTRDVPLECGALYHAAHGLVLFRERFAESGTRKAESGE